MSGLRSQREKPLFRLCLQPGGIPIAAGKVIRVLSTAWISTPLKNEYLYHFLNAIEVFSFFYK